MSLAFSIFLQQINVRERTAQTETLQSSDFSRNLLFRLQSCPPHAPNPLSLSCVPFLKFLVWFPMSTELYLSFEANATPMHGELDGEGKF
jgi:hypothetical protein